MLCILATRPPMLAHDAVATLSGHSFGPSEGGGYLCEAPWRGTQTGDERFRPRRDRLNCPKFPRGGDACAMPSCHAEVQTSNGSSHESVPTQKAAHPSDVVSRRTCWARKSPLPTACTTVGPCGTASGPRCTTTVSWPTRCPPATGAERGRPSWRLRRRGPAGLGAPGKVLQLGCQHLHPVLHLRLEALLMSLARVFD